MDPVIALEKLKNAQSNWEKIPKNRVVDVLNKKGDEQIALFFQSSFYRIMLQVMIGPRFGVRERCIVLDMRDKDVEIDHLVVANYAPYNDFVRETFLKLPERIWQIKKTKNREALKDAIKVWLTSEFQDLQNSPKECEHRFRTFCREIETGSISTVRYAMTRF